MRLKNNIAVCYVRLGRLESAESIYLELLEKLDKQEEDYDYKKGRLAGNLASVYMNQYQAVKVIEIFQEIRPLLNKEKYAKREDFQAMKHRILNTIGTAYIIENKPKDALPLLKTSSEYFRNKQSHKEFAQSLGSLAHCYYSLGDFLQAYSHYEQCIAIATEHNYQQLIQITYAQLSYVYVADKKYELGIEYLHKSYKLRDSLSGAEVQAKINALEIAHAETLKEQELIQLEQAHQIKQQRLQSGISIVSLVALLLVGFVIAQYRSRKVQAELQTLKLATINQELSYQKQDITKLALEISKKHDFSKNMLEQLRHFRKHVGSEAKKEWQFFENSIQNYLLSNEEQQLLHENVEQVNEAFFGKLAKDFPDLSKGEREICSYLRLGLSNKEIAVLRGVTPQAVRTSRYRMRKKLQLDEKQNVELFLQHL